MKYVCGIAIVTQRCSVAKNVGCFQRHLFVCGFVCQRDNFQTSKHWMMKLVGRCVAQKSRPSSNLGVIAPAGVHNAAKCGALLSHDAYGITQNVNKVMRSDETSHRTHRVHSTCVRLQR